MIYVGWAVLAVAALTCALALATRLFGHVKTIAQYETGAAHESYPRRVLVAFDQFCNVVAGGDPDETISARSARWAARSKRGFFLWRLVARAMIAWLDFIQPGHDLGARAGDLERAQIVERLEDQSLGIKGES